MLHVTMLHAIIKVFYIHQNNPTSPIPQHIKAFSKNPLAFSTIGAGKHIAEEISLHKCNIVTL
jgi:hypothetical protein